MLLSPAEFTETVAGPLGWFYALAAGSNAIAAFYSRGRRHWGRMLVWLAVAVAFGILAWRSFTGSPPGFSDTIKAAMNATMGPVTLTLGSMALLAVSFLARRLLVVPAVGWTILNLSLAWLGLSLADRNFAAIVAKPDNVPIVAMVFLLGFFTWTATRQAVRNDDRLARGEKPEESDYADTVFVWPDVIYLEVIIAVLATAGLIVWSLMLHAPLEQPANPEVTPNPSKAPWYFLGLQELLVYFPPWLAGVVIPLLIIFGLMAIPYLDTKPTGNGYYSIRRREGAYLVFQFGFLQLWVLLILIGTFLRGPNWTFFGLYEYHDPHRVAAMANVTLADYFWTGLLGRDVPQVVPGLGVMRHMAGVCWRELPGLLLTLVYFVGLPLILGRTLLRGVRQEMGRARFAVMILLLLGMLAVPIKMILVWTAHLSYVVNMPEYFFNF